MCNIKKIKNDITHVCINDTELIIKIFTQNYFYKRLTKFLYDCYGIDCFYMHFPL